MANKPSQGRLLKSTIDNRKLSRGWNKAPAKLFHGEMSTAGTKLKVNLPGCFYQFCKGKTCVSLSEFLVSLKLKNQFQIFNTHPVIQMPEISYLLKAGR